MQRLAPIFLILALLMAEVPPATAGASSPAEVEQMVTEFERLFESLVGELDRDRLSFKRLESGFLSLSYALPESKSSGLSLFNDEKPIRTLSGGHMASEPTSPATMVKAVVSNRETEYNLWWAVLNTSELDETRTTTVRVTGPEGFIISAADEVVYTANSVSLVWFNPEMPFAAPGLYVHRTTVRTGGRLFYRFWVEE